MKLTIVALLAGAAILGLLMPADAAPPTVMPSPGYDARLREQQAARQRSAEPVVPATQPAKKRRNSKKQAR